MKRKKILIILSIIVLLIGIAVYSKEKKKQESSLPNVNEEYLNYFKENAKYEKILTYTQHDINNDKVDDLLVVYKKGKNHNEMVGVISDNENVYMTEPIRAPIDDILIEFKDIDDKNEMELILSGSKNGNVGYAIYRLENKKLVDLFGEGMNACC
ncbi:Cys-Cys-COOH (seleno)protein SaoC [Paraclostridium bifermentans]|uniref:Cys-Cys-COOH (seleno)protein SaoC n=1 Tax=Paraclostridium bifermentans TaxID=1490 RepID=UPI0006B3ADBC|nr:Cys-Cys-COOH (seleno)protein SaoC [Paraclostridium bifermentans]OSB10737.1 hypothetical protein B2H97_07265 [Paraclostridium bifermentans]